MQIFIRVLPWIHHLVTLIDRHPHGSRKQSSIEDMCIQGKPAHRPSNSTFPEERSSSHAAPQHRALAGISLRGIVPQGTAVKLPEATMSCKCAAAEEAGVSATADQHRAGSTAFRAGVLHSSFNQYRRQLTEQRSIPVPQRAMLATQAATRDNQRTQEEALEGRGAASGTAMATPL